MAVNNMLSREDEADFNSASGAVNIGDDWEDDAEDIFSLLDHPEGLLLEGEGGFQDDIIDRSSSPRFRREILMDCGNVQFIPPNYPSLDRNLGDHATYTDRRKRRRFDTQGFLRNPETYGGRAAESRLFLRNMGLPDEKGLQQEEESGYETVSGSTKCVESNVQLGDRLEFWPTSSAESVGSHFVSIAALYTELVAINSRGELHQWKWQSPEPFNPHGVNSPPFNLMEQSETGASPVNHRHPRATSLGITHEKVVSLSGCVTRASIMTASGAIATWMDEMLPSLFHSAAPASSAAATAATAALMRLEHPAIHFNELKAEVVIRVSTAPLITVVQCASGAVFWWGVLPSYIRQRNAEKQKHSSSAATAPTTTGTTANASRHRSTSGSSEVGSKTPVANNATTCAPPLSPGDLVCMRNAPMFHSGAIGFTLTNGIPKVGVLLEDAWKLTDVCRFRVKSPSALRGQTGVVVVGTGGTIAGKSSSTEAIHALTCPYVQAAAAAAAAAAAQTDHEPPSADSGALEMPPPPSPASSTCSDHSGPVKVSPRTFKRKKAPSTSSDGSGNGGGASGSCARRGLDQLDQQQQQLPKQTSKPITSKPQYDEEIEDWCLSEVVFVEDGRTQPVGVLLKIDGTIAAVKFLKEQDRACLAARCPSAPVCLFINHITKTTPALQKPFVAPPAASSSSSASSLVSPHDPMAWLNDCRLLKKDDLMQVKQTVGGGLSQRVPDFVQPTPRHILMNFLTTKSNSLPTNISKKRIFALVPENSRLHAIVGRAEPETAIGSGEEQRMRHLEYHVFTLNGKTVSSRRLPALSKPTGGLDDAIEANGAKSSYSDIMLTCPAERPLLLRDNAGVVFPFLPPSRPGQESWVFPPWLDLPAVQCAALSWISASPPRAISATTSTPTSQRDTEATTTTSTSRVGGENGKKLTLSSAAAAGDLQGDPRLLLGVVVVRETSLLQHILRADESKVEETLRLLNTAPPCQVESVASEMADGHRTILHVAVLMCAPMTRETPEMTDRLENILKRAGSGNIGSISVPPSQPPPPSSDGSGWTTISPSPPPPPPPPLPRSLHSLLNLSASSNQRSSNVGVASSAATASSSTSSVHDLFIRSPLEAAAASAVEAAAAVSVAAASSSSTSSSGHFCHMAPLPATEEVSRRVASHRILRALVLHPRLRTLLPRLLACLSDDGLTPFMLAIQCKAYQVAVFLLDFLAELEGIPSDGSEESAHQFRYTRLMRYLFPLSARLDDSPLFTLCYNDTCSFTWTGPNHIRQDIFECRTCGLMDSLCCCSECARVCHKGHDCRLKRTSPTAYCDCWEKCRCRSLVLGHQASRLSLFQRLLLHTDLVYLPNRANEHLLVYLTRCVERQTREQKQYKSARRRGGSSGGGGSGGGGGGSGSGGVERGALPGARAGASALDEPEHDLEPPTFSRDALELVLDSKAAAASLLCDCKNVVATESFSKFGDRKGKAGACQSVMAIQSGTSQLDDFVFTLLCKCPAEFVQRLVNTLARSLSDHLSSDRGVWRLLSLSLPSITSSGTEITDAYFYCQRGIARFLRSVARVYVGLMLELSPDHHKKKPRLVTQAQPLELARFVFFQLAPVALPELASLAVKVVTPVRIGALRSTATFNLTSQQGEAIHGLDQVLSAERSSFSRSRQSQPSICTSSINDFSSLGNALDCSNSVIRLLLYGCDSTDPDASTLLPTWKVNERQQPLASPPKTEQQQQQQRKPSQPSERGKSCATTDATLYNVEEPMVTCTSFFYLAG
ncbi:E3 ubiquitin-protein ligase UBR5 [Taenia solium]|eukprot:TsM_000054000 transcript=TsM_000054000 gene=TsM_000054000